MFDISQTRGRPLPQPLHHESEELIAAMIQSSPVGLQLSEQLPAQIQAQYVPAQRTIYLRNGMDAGVTFCCLARELAHAEYARLPGYRRRDFAAQAYCAAYVLTQKYAVPAPPFQFDRITADLTGGGTAVAAAISLRRENDGLFGIPPAWPRAAGTAGADGFG